MQSGRQLKEHDAQRKDIGRVRHRFAASLFGRHISHGAQQCARRCLESERGGFRI